MHAPAHISFAPVLYIKNGVTDISFYTKALGAVEVMRFSNDDGSLHVAELSINGAIFHVHEETGKSNLFNPSKHNGVTALIGLFVPDVDAVMEKAEKNGAEVIAPAQDYDYGYRQGEIKDPFGHCWVIQKKI
ncbi:PhnB protein [Hydrobacter penzbergensis]|uniref:PhnB protein n=1 Tax=Hydrobacter penzbergensis TaxID=1235997 RepID=A0A8X8IDN8_9BACT|nr:VOC family protein [Hydrobacter penzbergensis]SDX17862.1 PhnB protein [Hydrobacter penzbergensis]